MTLASATNAHGSRITRRLLALLGGACLASGCAAPQIESLVVGPAREGQPVDVAVQISSSMLARPGTPAMQVRNDGTGKPYSAAGPMNQRAADKYQGQLPPQPYGKNTLQVRVPAGSETVVREQPFYVGARAACFAFDAKDSSLQGWRLHGVFDNGNPVAQVAKCNAAPNDATALNGALLRSAGVNYPEVFPGDFSALAVPLGSACFPTTLPSGNRWTVDFVSPDLAQRADWQVAQFSFAIRSADAASLPNDRWPRAQAMLKVRKPDGAESYYAEQGAVGAFRYETVTAEWQRFTFSFAPPAGSTVLEARVRYFGAPAERGSDSVVNLDLVCPGS